jgi:hypothetical protein
VGDGLPHFLRAFGFGGDVQSGIGPGDAGAGLPLAEPGVQLVEEGSDLIEARLACWQEMERRVAADIRQRQRDGAQARRSDRQCTVLLVEPSVTIGVSPLLGHLVQAAVVALRHLITCNVEQVLVFLQEPQADEVLQRLARGGGAANRESEDEQVLKQAEVGRDHGRRGEECLLLLGDGAKLAEEQAVLVLLIQAPGQHPVSGVGGLCEVAEVLVHPAELSGLVADDDPVLADLLLDEGAQHMALEQARGGDELGDDGVRIRPAVRTFPDCR